MGGRADYLSAAGWAVLGIAIGLMWLVLALLRFLELPISPYRVQEDA